MRIIHVAAALLICLSAGGCAKGNDVNLKLEGDHTVDVRPGRGFKVELDANPTTGYMWRVSVEKGKDIIKQLGDPEYNRGGDLIGGGGAEIFTFRADGKGEGEIVFKYVRPWENKEIKKHVLKVMLSNFAGQSRRLIPRRLFLLR